MIPQDFLTAIAQEHHLSGSEHEVLVLAMDGKPTAAIAQDLGISGDAVRKRLSEVYQKFRISGRGPVKLTRLQQLLVSRYQNQTPKQPSSLSSVPPGSNTVAKAESLSSAHYWGEAPDTSVFYGRKAELSQLDRWVLQSQCRLVTILGMAGMGKTALTVQLARNIHDDFESFVWLSLRQAPPLHELLHQLTHLLNHTAASSNDVQPSPEMIKSQMSNLIHYCRNHRCLLVLDGVESVLQSSCFSGIYRDGYADYGDLFRRLGQASHQSCVLVTSREKPSEISLLEGETAPVRSLMLGGLTDADAQQLLTEKGITGDKQKWTDLIHGYRGNPFMLKMVATTIREVFDGDVTAFLTTTLLTHDINDYIGDILERVSDIEEAIVHHIAQQQRPLSMNDLISALPTSSPQDLIQALQSLKQRSLLETSEGRFYLPPVVMTFVAQERCDA